MKTPYSQGFEAGVAYFEGQKKQAYWQGHKDGLQTALDAVETLDFDFYASYGMILAKTALKQAQKKAQDIDEMDLPDT
jgi:ABC-type transport system involved in cytochrome c biogenesis ATPase subunit